MGPTDLHKAESSGPARTHIARGAFLLIKRARERACTYIHRGRKHAHAYPLLRAQAAHERAGTQKRRACLVALTIRPPTYEISRFIIILLCLLSLSLFSLRILPPPLPSFLLSSFRFFSFARPRRPFAARARSPVRMRWTLHALIHPALFSWRARVCPSSI